MAINRNQPKAASQRSNNFTIAQEYQAKPGELYPGFIQYLSKIILTELDMFQAWVGPFPYTFMSFWANFAGITQENLKRIVQILFELG